MAQSFVRPALEKRGVDMQKVMREAASAQVRDRTFQEDTIASKALLMAHNLALTLNGHLEQLVKEPVSKDWQANMLSGLSDACRQALILHGQLQAAPDKYSCIWPSSGRAGKREEMELWRGNGGAKVAFVVSPGIKCKSVEQDVFPQPGVVARAVVATRD